MHRDSSSEGLALVTTENHGRAIQLAHAIGRMESSLSDVEGALQATIGAELPANHPVILELGKTKLATLRTLDVLRSTLRRLR